MLVWTLPSFSPARDTRGHPAFNSIVMRMLWRFYTWRLTQAGRWFLWPTFGFFAYTSASLDYYAFVPLCYACAIWLVACIAAVLYRPRVKLEVRHSDRVCAGEILPIDVDVNWPGSQPRVDLYILPHRLQDEVDAEPQDGMLIPEPGEDGRSRVRTGLRCRKRGVYKLLGLRVETDFPFGLCRSSRTHPDERSLLVYPHFHPLARMDLPMGRRYQPGGVALLSVVGESVEYVGNREYRYGDNLRDIDWRATARLDHLIVREYREEYLLRVAVVLDTFVPNAGKPKCDERDLENFERAVSMCAAVGDFLARQDYVVDIFAAGPHLYHLTAGRSLAYLDQILDILACLKVGDAEPFELVEPELCENLSRISSVICVFLNWDKQRRDFVERLRRQGVGVKVVIIRDKACAENPSEDESVPGGLAHFSAQDFARGVQEL